MSTVVMRVDLECEKCYKKIRKVLCKVQGLFLPVSQSQVITLTLLQEKGGKTIVQIKLQEKNEFLNLG
jgi:copper chaperone CopZ